MDALIHSHVTQGEKASSPDLGRMKFEGVVAESFFLSTAIFDARHKIPISQAKFHPLLGNYCKPALKLTSSFTSQGLTGPQNPSSNAPETIERAALDTTKDVPPSASHKSERVHILVNSPSLKTHGIRHLVARRRFPGRRRTYRLRQNSSQALSIPPEDMDVAKLLHAYGVGSSSCRKYFAKELGADVAIFDIVGGPSFEVVGVTVVVKFE